MDGFEESPEETLEVWSPGKVTNHPQIHRLESTANAGFLELCAAVGVQDQGLFLYWSWNIRFQSSSEVVHFLVLVAPGDLSFPCESLHRVECP